MLRGEVLALFSLSTGYMNQFKADDYVDIIIFELMVEVTDRMNSMLHNLEQRKYTLKLSAAQAVAFIAFWSRINLSRHPYERVAIARIIEAIDKAYSSNKIQFTNNNF